MTEKLLQKLAERYTLQPKDVGQFGKMKVSGMTFQIRAYEAEGLGWVSVMTASGFFGLMKMDTLIVNPTCVDMPLLSYDRVLAMGNDTLIWELYDTFLTKMGLPALEKAKADAQGLPAHDLGSHWYDSIKLPQSYAKKGKKPHRSAFDRAAEDYLQAYLADAASAPACDPAKKREKAAVYVEGLLSHGGPSTDVFKKNLGPEVTARLFRKVLFGTQV